MADRILLILLSGGEVEEGQILEREGESLEESEQGQI